MTDILQYVDSIFRVRFCAVHYNQFIMAGGDKTRWTKYKNTWYSRNDKLTGLHLCNKNGCSANAFRIEKGFTNVGGIPTRGKAA